MRELSLGLIRPNEWLRVWRKEAGVGLINGLALGGLLGVVAAMYGSNAWLGLVVGGVGWLAKRRIGGYTGDVLGASEQLAETAAAVTLVAALAAF